MAALQALVAIRLYFTSQVLPDPKFFKLSSISINRFFILGFPSIIGTSLIDIVLSPNNSILNPVF
jgi:hypothetical protein